jgi:neutral ceramidase
MYGYGPEGKEARGYRTRLYARAIVLEDVTGERVAFVVADLAVISLLLQRSVAQRIAGTTGIGADRLMLAATHTHAGPAHFIGVIQFDMHGSSVTGFDTTMVTFLADRIGRAVTDAVADLRPARLGTAAIPIWGYTRNRSYEAFRQNPDSLVSFEPPADMVLDEEQLAVDPTWTMLRIDLLDSEDGIYKPAGAFSVFAMHANAIPSANDLFDGDIQAAIQDGLETHIDSLNGHEARDHPRAVHALAYGAGGDVVATYPMEARCPPPEFRFGHRPGGPRTPPPAEGWQPAQRERIERCISAARQYVDSAGRALSERVIAAFDSLGDHLSGGARVRRAFRALDLTGPGAPDGLCDEPRVGTAALVGSSGSNTRYDGWRFLYLAPLGYERGGSAVSQGTTGCHAPKRKAFGPLQPWIIGDHGFPEIAQLMVIQIGDLLLATVPAEATVTTGVMIRNEVRHRATLSGLEFASVGIVSLVNGDLRYVTTPHEYAVQLYEGASTLYGPQSAVVLAGQLGKLTAELALASEHRSEPRVDSAIAYAAKPKIILQPRNTGPPREAIERRVIESGCDGSDYIAIWIDSYPGRLVPADAPVLRIDLQTDAGWQPVAWDGDPSLEVRALKPKGREGYLWQVRWQTDVKSTRGHRLVLLARDGMSEIEGEPFEVCSN